MKLPNDPSAEQAVLGAVMLKSQILPQVRAMLGPEDFYQPSHRVIFAAMGELERKGQAIDPLTVSSQLDAKGELRKVEGGEQYLVHLLDEVPTAENVAAYARIVVEKSALRRLTQVATEVRAKACGEVAAGDFAEMVDAFQEQVFAVGNRLRPETLAAWNEVLMRAFAGITELRAGRVKGVPTGFASLDRILGGMQEDLLLLAGRPSMGKSALAKDIALYVARVIKAPVLVFSLEMSNEQWGERALAGESGLDLSHLRRGEFRNAEEWTRLRETYRAIADLPISFDESASPSILEIRGKARRWAMERAKGRGLVIVDYLQLIRPTNRRDPREQQIAEISRGLKNLATKELKMPVLALAQLSRDLERREEKRPVLSDLRESGSLEQDADTVFFVHRPEVYTRDPEDKGVAEIIVAKHRNGPTGTANLRFDGKYTRFSDADGATPPPPARQEALPV